MTQMRLAYVNVPVADLDRSVAFFRDRVGLALKFADAEFGYAEFDTPGAGFAVVQDPAAVGRHTGIGFAVERTSTPRMRNCPKPAWSSPDRRRANRGAATWRSSPTPTATPSIWIRFEGTKPFPSPATGGRSRRRWPCGRFPRRDDERRTCARGSCRRLIGRRRARPLPEADPLHTPASRTATFRQRQSRRTC